MAESVFDTYDFIPVDGDPFQRSRSPVPLAVQVADADRAPAPSQLDMSVSMNNSNADALTQAAAIPTSSLQETPKESLVGKLGRSFVKEIANLSGEGLAHYARNEAHPIENRLISAGLEEGSRMLDAVPNALHQFVGPMYGEGHVPQFWDAADQGSAASQYAGAGINLASAMVSPGGEGAVGAGWNPKALEYLKGLTKKKPPMLPETDAMVQHMIGQGPDYADSLAKYAPDGTPGKGYATMATMKHNVEEAAKPKPPPPSVAPSAPVPTAPGVVTLTPAQKAAIQGAKAPVTVAQPGTGLPVPAGTPAAAGAAPLPYIKGGPFDTTKYVKSTPAKVTKAPKMPTVKATPLTAEQALFTPAGAATDKQLDKLFSTYVGPLNVPTMKPYDPNVTGVAALAHETAPGTSGMTTPFNPSGLPMDQASVKQRMKDLGFGPVGGNWLYWRGVKQHGPFSWDSAAVGYRNPAGKTNEPGLFLAPDANVKGKPGKPIAAMYGPAVNAHVIRSENPLVISWKKASGGGTYSSVAMQKVIKDAWAKGHDTLLLKDISDLGGVHDQMVVRNPNQLRHPHAAFDPKYKDLPNLLAARGLGVQLPPIVAQDQEMGGE